MPWLEKRGNKFRIKFRFGGSNHSVPLKTSDQRKAEGHLIRFEENLCLLEQGRLELPEGADLGVFLLSDGRRTQKGDRKKACTVAELFALYRGNLTPEVKEANTRKCESVHMRHLERLLKPTTPLDRVVPASLQSYVDARAKERRGALHVKPQTIKKELATLQAIWNWAHKRDHAPVVPSTVGLTFPREAPREKFRTYEEVKRIVDRGGLKPHEARALWDSLFLSTAEVAEVLVHVRDRELPTWVYPFFVAVAHTGARRSELLRARVEDFDFEHKVVTLREKKKSKSSDTQRTVDMTPFLEKVMRDYFAKGHPGGALAFAAEPNVPLSDSVSQKMVRKALRGSKWIVMRGYHTFRHSFASNLAAAGIDQRVIAALMGHMTVEMQNRYRHLFPAQRRAAVASVYA